MKKMYWVHRVAMAFEMYKVFLFPFSNKEKWSTFITIFRVFRWVTLSKFVLFSTIWPLCLINVDINKIFLLTWCWYHFFFLTKLDEKSREISSSLVHDTGNPSVSMNDKHSMGNFWTQFPVNISIRWAVKTDINITVVCCKGMQARKYRTIQ